MKEFGEIVPIEIDPFMVYKLKTCTGYRLKSGGDLIAANIVLVALNLDLLIHKPKNEKIDD